MTVCRNDTVSWTRPRSSGRLHNSEKLKRTSEYASKIVAYISFHSRLLECLLSPRIAFATLTELVTSVHTCLTYRCIEYLMHPVWVR
jgi:hypothetical protein